jgi:hypothetical protein
MNLLTIVALFCITDGSQTIAGNNVTDWELFEYGDSYEENANTCEALGYPIYTVNSETIEYINIHVLDGAF